MIGQLFYGKVYSLADPDKKKKIQVRLLPELQDADPSTLPWVRPFSEYSSTSKEDSYDPPSVNSPVWVVFTDSYFQTGYWLAGPPAEDNIDFSAIVTGLNPIGLSTQNYGETHYRKFSDGTIQFWNPTSKEFGVLHSTGAWSIIRANGTIEFSGPGKKNSLILDASGEVKYDATVTGHTFTGKDMTYEGDYLISYSKLKAILENLITALGNHVQTDPLSGLTGGPLAAILMNALFPTTPTDLINMKTAK